MCFMCLTIIIWVGIGQWWYIALLHLLAPMVMCQEKSTNHYVKLIREWKDHKEWKNEKKRKMKGPIKGKLRREWNSYEKYKSLPLENS